MLELRDYQRSAVDALFEYWSDKPGSPLIVLPTGAGKSLVLATICKELLENYPGMRILIVTHVRELILGNYKELLTIWPFAPCGIFSAGVGRRDAHAQIIFGGVQTIYNKTEEIGHIDLIAIDEAHLIPRKADTQYGKLFAGLEAINPDVKRIGLTATDYRLGEGRLTDGDGAMFDDVCFEQPIGDMIDGGYLCRPISKGMATAFDLTGVGKVGGDYNQGNLQAAVDKEDVNAAVVDEIITYGRDRRAWLLFCSGVEHAFHMRDEIRKRAINGVPITCEAISGGTPTAERDRILADFKAGKIKALSNNSVLTTGTNLPIIDLVAFCRPTLSAGLYVQMAGRGLRLYPGKANCLFLDFAGVVRKHGPIDAVVPPHMRSGSGEAPVKQCPQDRADAKGQMGCGSLVHASARCCPDCNYDFPIDDKPKITGQAEDVPMLSKGEATWRPVTERRFYIHQKPGKPDSVKCVYVCGMTQINDFMGPGHMGYFKAKTDKWWAKHSGARPFPKDSLEFLQRQAELNITESVAVRPSGKYWEVSDYKPGEAKAHDNDNERPSANDNGIGYARWDELEVPF
ncbi:MULTISPECIES: DEAD/DEAH box helicase [unclassified Mesorhizobium]|uniref:DEAD/DEAH box helicase n=1 Tax=unclassified Mesorhizobium TaxID=325217 RepID=UPI001FEE22E4|nr:MULTISPECIES: DEAD/DEAH box helicase [unclassified Mesorhizobium]